MAENLTPQQALAVNDRGGRLLVSAAAGSGKTKVLVDRLLSYLEDPLEPANIDDFLIITYTKAAAAELRAKIAEKISERVARSPENRHLQRQMQRLYLAKISTVHAFCSDILRENAHHLEISANFRVAEENECLALQLKAADDVLEDAYLNIAQDAGFSAFIETLGTGRNDARVPQLIFDTYGRAVCHLDPEKWLNDCLQAYHTESVTDASETIWGKYLMEDLRDYLRMQIEAVSASAEAARSVIGFEKPVALLDETVDQLVALSKCVTWDEVISHANIEFGTLAFPRKCPDPDLAARIKAVRNACKKGLEKKLRRFTAPSAQILDELQRSKTVIDGMIAVVRNFSKRYAALKRSKNVLDFTDLEHMTLDLLLGRSRQGPTLLAKEIGQRFKEVMVDEYQDSNAVQDAIYGALTAKRNNCFMVGDVKQSIYQFRLADPTIFLEKYNSFVPAEKALPGEGRKVLLSKNFRSSAAVIDAVNDVFSLCMSPDVGGLYYTRDEMLYEGVAHIPLDDTEVELHYIDVQQDTYAEEALFTAKRIHNMLTSECKIRDGDALREVKPDDIVILLRSPGSVAWEFQQALENLGIRCTTGAQTDLLQFEEIQVISAILQVISNPLQDIPLAAVLSSRVFQFTADDLARIRNTQKWGSLYSALCKCDDSKSRRFIEALSKLREYARLNTLPKLLERIFVTVGIDNIYAALPDGDARIENLQNFYQMACTYMTNEQGSLDTFLNHLELMKERGLSAPNDASVEGAVRIMSIHKSKGLEFPVVFLCGLSKDFNQEDVRGQILCDKTMGIGVVNTNSEQRVRYPTIAKNAIAAKMIADSVSEELRVLYVAMTRAKDRLVMTYASRKIQEYLETLTLRSAFTKPELFSSDASCAGDWILMTACTDRKMMQTVNLHPWLISTVTVDLEENQNTHEITGSVLKTVLPIDQMAESLSFVYPYPEATQTPSKQTATQRKGRIKDQEVAEHASTKTFSPRKWRKPSFAANERDATELGQAVHAVMQRIQFQNYTSVTDVEREVEKLCERGYIAAELAEHIDCHKILDFFKTDIGRKVCESDKILREFKFSVLVDGKVYADALNGEKILLQGVVDCAILENDGITVIDFKTDHIRQEELDQRVIAYKDQIDMYALALSRIYGMPVKTKLLYFFELSRAVAIQ